MSYVNENDGWNRKVCTINNECVRNRNQKQHQSTKQQKTMENMTATVAIENRFLKFYFYCTASVTMNLVFLFHTKCRLKGKVSLNMFFFSGFCKESNIIYVPNGLKVFI